MPSRSFRFLYSNFHARSNLSSLFERRETHRVAPKRLSVSVSSELLFSRGGENDHEGSFQSRVKLTVYSKLFETCSKIDLKIRPKVGRLAISSFHYRSMTRHVSRCIDDEDIPFTESQASSVYIISRLYHYRGLENVCKYFAKRNGQWAAYGRI